jgi:hypothetical protein
MTRSSSKANDLEPQDFPAVTKTPFSRSIVPNILLPNVKHGAGPSGTDRRSTLSKRGYSFSRSIEMSRSIFRNKRVNSAVRCAFIDSCPRNFIIIVEPDIECAKFFGSIDNDDGRN